mmetsp:Transcript_18640/g.60977  ORF Transcript_18640/g.60977 Transcript_18640/m.60977 type:complete len:262 (-) Transcript_18640:1167-1952(-)
MPSLPHSALKACISLWEMPFRPTRTLARRGRIGGAGLRRSSLAASSRTSRSCSKSPAAASLQRSSVLVGDAGRDSGTSTSAGASISCAYSAALPAALPAAVFSMSAHHFGVPTRASSAAPPMSRTAGLPLSCAMRASRAWSTSRSSIRACSKRSSCRWRSSARRASRSLRRDATCTRPSSPIWLLKKLRASASGQWPRRSESHSIAAPSGPIGLDANEIVSSRSQSGSQRPMKRCSCAGPHPLELNRSRVALRRVVTAVLA